MRFELLLKASFTQNPDQLMTYIEVRLAMIRFTALILDFRKISERKLASIFQSERVSL
jgi:hypothetical protein